MVLDPVDRDSLGNRLARALSIEFQSISDRVGSETRGKGQIVRIGPGTELASANTQGQVLLVAGYVVSAQRNVPTPCEMNRTP